MFECDDVAYACVAVDHSQALQQPLLSGSFFIVKSAHVCAVSARKELTSAATRNTLLQVVESSHEVRNLVFITSFDSCLVNTLQPRDIASFSPAERHNCKRELSRFHPYPEHIFKYDENFDDSFMLPAPTGLNESVEDVIRVVATMHCVGFKAFITDSLLGYTRVLDMLQI